MLFRYEVDMAYAQALKYDLPGEEQVQRIGSFNVTESRSHHKCLAFLLVPQIYEYISSPPRETLPVKITKCVDFCHILNVTPKSEEKIKNKAWKLDTSFEKVICKGNDEMMSKESLLRGSPVALSLADNRILGLLDYTMINGNRFMYCRPIHVIMKDVHAKLASVEWDTSVEEIFDCKLPG